MVAKKTENEDHNRNTKGIELSYEDHVATVKQDVVTVFVVFDKNIVPEKMVDCNTITNRINVEIAT